MHQIIGPLIFFSVVGVIVAVTYYSIMQRHDDNRGRSEAWREFARIKGGVFHLGEQWLFGKDPDIIEYDIGATRVCLDTKVVKRGQGERDEYTRARVKPAVGKVPKFSVYPDGWFTSIIKQWGAPDVVLGQDKEFDDMFVVEAESPGQVWRLWTPRAMELMRLYVQRGSATGDGTEIRVQVSEYVTHHGMLDTLGHIAAELGRVGLLGLDALMALPDAQVELPSGSWDARQPPRATVAIGPAQVIVTPVFEDGEVRTRASVQGVALGHELTVTLEGEGQADADHLERARVPDAAHGHLIAAGAGRLEVAGTKACFLFPHVEFDPQRIMAACRGLAVFTQAPSQGVFR